MAVHSILVVVAVMLSCACSDKNESKQGMHCFGFPETGIHGVLRVRKPDSESRDLVVERLALRQGGIYVYDHEKKSLTQVEPTRWKEAKGVVTRHGTFRSLDARDPDVKLGATGYKLLQWSKESGTRQIATAGRWVMRSSWSFECGLLAVLTRDKEPKKGMKEPGTHYIELFTHPEGQPVGKPYKLPFTDFNNIEEVCWSSGDTHVIVSTIDSRQVCIIEVPDRKKDGRLKDE